MEITVPLWSGSTSQTKCSCQTCKILSDSTPCFFSFSLKQLTALCVNTHWICCLLFIFCTMQFIYSQCCEWNQLLTMSDGSPHENKPKLEQFIYFTWETFVLWCHMMLNKNGLFAYIVRSLSTKSDQSTPTQFWWSKLAFRFWMFNFNSEECFFSPPKLSFWLLFICLFVKYNI